MSTDRTSTTRPNSCSTQPHAEGVDLRCREAGAGDLPEIRRLLRVSDLPLDGVDESLMPATVVAVNETSVVGSASVELHGRFGLLRSVVVAPEMRTAGIGTKLVGNRVVWATRHDLDALYLFTETAAPFFQRHGFERVDRESLPLEIRSCPEFDLCPATSTSMRLGLEASEISDRIDARYSAAARRVRTAASESEPNLAGASCGYSATDVASVPSSAIAASLGCGNPSAVAALAKGEVVLDLGCGGGLDVLLSARRVGPEGFAYGIDANPEMLKVAEDNLARSEVKNVRFLKGRIEELPLEGDHVDVVISNCVVNLSPDKPRAFREMYRVLRPGGRLAIADIVAIAPGSSLARRESERALGCLAGTLTVEDAATLLDSIGFIDVEIEESRVFAIDDIGTRGSERSLERCDSGLLMSAIIRGAKPIQKESSE